MEEMLYLCSVIQKTNKTMVTYCEYREIGRLCIMIWCFPGMEYLFMEDNNCKHLFGKFYWKGK